MAVSTTSVPKSKSGFLNRRVLGRVSLPQRGPFHAGVRRQLHYRSSYDRNSSSQVSTTNIGTPKPATTKFCRIIESKNSIFPVGETIVGNLGWRTHSIVKPTDDCDIYILPDIGTLPLSAALGVIGATGISAYFGFLYICKPVEGDTVVVTGAAGAVGSIVGQIAKIKGCNVIGITGSEDKAHWLESLGFDYVINYKATKNLAEDLKIGAPKGIDCYFDNVSTELLNINNVPRFGRLAAI